MRMLVLGAGRMGLGAVHDLVSQPDVTGVTVADFDAAKAHDIARRYPSKVTAAQIDCNDHAAVVALMRGHDSAISCVNYWLNERLARAAIEAGTHFCDLGGNNDVVDAELALDAEARAAGVNIVPDCGLAPGMVAVLVAHGAQQFQQLDEVHIRVGGLPQDPRPPLDYQLVFSVEGLINEYIEPARVIRNGKVTIVESMTEVESLEFPPPFGQMEAFQTSGGTSTLVETFLGNVKELDYKTIRFPGHCAKFKTMIDLGLCSSEPMTVDGVTVKPRRVLGDLLVQNLPHDEPDVVLVRVKFAGDGRRLRYDIIDRQDPETGLSAMMRTTAFPASIVALMMARGQTTSRGALPQERCIPPDAFMQELAQRKIDVHISEG
ncbi:MAG: saccharopine dehydrogenase NADP-binding domain-containing protein [Acidobacteria bacterium]|nr:saccharopine dehydrogenase NADP-binding domain-containing protein [Acidobacteriota bacterium]MBV9474735.1 saccharopine dehydrogenase NADP-binding domain-containing protein [Acidobacteriota bacterium]